MEYRFCITIFFALSMTLKKKLSSKQELKGNNNGNDLKMVWK